MATRLEPSATRGRWTVGSTGRARPACERRRPARRIRRQGRAGGAVPRRSEKGSRGVSSASAAAESDEWSVAPRGHRRRRRGRGSPGTGQGFPEARRGGAVPLLRECPPPPGGPSRSHARRRGEGPRSGRVFPDPGRHPVTVDRVVLPDAPGWGRVTAHMGKPVVVDVKTMMRPVPVMPAPEVRHDDDADAEAEAAHDSDGGDDGIAEERTWCVHPRPVHRTRVIHRDVDDLRIGGTMPIAWSWVSTICCGVATRVPADCAR